ncbi:MAG: hypothetical protein JXE06_10760 [Coriobacteriia bacterium]|nr:hypothetical protein [Coriobacteriia bacterium]MBN2822279.1 hypothetical protein [Coriobacteriia bacterium]
MDALIVVLLLVAIAGSLIMIGRVLDRIRAVRDDEKFAGWYQGKTHDVSQTGGTKSGEYDSMNDHGYRGRSGGL